MSSFVAIDFESANYNKNSICSMGAVTVKNGNIIDEFYSLIQPPGNKYHWRLTEIHKIKAADTKDSPTFFELWPQIEPLIKGQTLVAHNSSFEQNYLKATMEHYGLRYKELRADWRCTYRFAKAKCIVPSNLKAVCHRFGIPLKNHHNALDDSKACAKVFLSLNRRPV